MHDVRLRNEVSAAPPARVLIVGCGALGRELVTLTRDLPGVDVTCLPAELHNRPERIPEAVADRVRARGGDYDRVFVAYADCGTGGRLDAALAGLDGIERIPGAHCYEFYAGAAAFAALQDDEPGTFYLTDFLARQFDTLVVRGLGLDRHPELLSLYFGNYRRLVYLAQTDDPELVRRARAAADRLSLAFEVRSTGLGELGAALGPALAPALARALPSALAPTLSPALAPALARALAPALAPVLAPAVHAGSDASAKPRPADASTAPGARLSGAASLTPLPRAVARHTRPGRGCRRAQDAAVPQEIALGSLRTRPGRADGSPATDRTGRPAGARRGGGPAGTGRAGRDRGEAG